MSEQVPETIAKPILEQNLKVLLIDARTSFYKVQWFKIGEYFGPVDLGIHLARVHDSLNIGTGLLSGSIFPGSNRLIFSGNSPCWIGFYVSSMGGAGLVFDNLGINMFSLVGKAETPSVLVLNRVHGEEIQVRIEPINVHKVWKNGKLGVYSMMDYVYEKYAHEYIDTPRILATGPASMFSDIGAICSAPIKKNEVSNVDTWAGRGGFGTKMLREHGIAAVIYGGTYIDEDFRDRKVADNWFEQRYSKKLIAKDMEATTKYRFDPKFETGGTFGVNYATLGGRIITHNYKSIYWTEEQRLKIHKNWIVEHYLKQFNEESIEGKQQAHCGEPCVAVCKKLNGVYKKDYEPYQTMGPLCGIFDQRAAEKVNRYADTMGFDGISLGGVIAALMECLADGSLSMEDVGVSATPRFSLDSFDNVPDSMHNANIAVEIIDSIIFKKALITLEGGIRRLARTLEEKRGFNLMDKMIVLSFGRNGWMVPNQYWTPGALSPMAIMGKYYMHYGNEFLAPRKLGQANADRFLKELIGDNLGFCRFHRAWAEEMLPDIIEELYGKKEQFLKRLASTAARINARNSSIFWESDRNIDYVYTFLKRQVEVEGKTDPELLHWKKRFEENRMEAAQDYWYEIHKGISESLREFQ